MGDVLGKVVDNYLGKNNTYIVNGIFILIVFFSHIEQYISYYTGFEIIFFKIIHLFSQLMVTTFLFFSGYGIYENYKIKKTEYVSNFYKKRFLKTYVKWCLSILLFIIVNLILGNHYSLLHILISFTGWKSIGNSNWYMFDIFILYFIFIISFKYIKNNKSLGVNIILTLLFVFIIAVFKEPYWCNTIFCFPFGMLYSYHKKTIDKFILRSGNYLKILSILTIAFIIIYLVIHFSTFNNINNILLYNILSCIFVIIITLIMMKIQFRSCILRWIGENLFRIYILQRIPMMVFQNKFDNNLIYIGVCFIITLILSLFMKRVDFLLSNKKISVKL